MSTADGGTEMQKPPNRCGSGICRTIAAPSCTSQGCQPWAVFVRLSERCTEHHAVSRRASVAWSTVAVVPGLFAASYACKTGLYMPPFH
jgi:hypothetical protein